MENLGGGRKYRPNAVRSVHMTEVKILPYRPPALLIRCLLYGKREKFNSDLYTVEPHYFELAGETKNRLK